jgi:elongation factor G
MLESLAMYSDELMEQLLSETEVSQDVIHEVTKNATQQQGMTPIFLGSAYQNKGVQPLLDAIVRYLPSPKQRTINAESLAEEGTTIQLEADANQSFVGMAFKIVDDPFGQLTFIRIYRGKILKGTTYVNQRTGRKERFSRILRMHADKREEIDEALAGDIVAVMGIDCNSGDTYAPKSGTCTLESMFVPDPVISIAITPRKRVDVDRLGKALMRFRREDPTFRVFSDEETGEMLISGMGELHLEVYLERIRREYKVELDASPPKVSYREAPTITAEFNYKHRKQTGGSGQYAHIVGRLIVLPTDAEDAFTFEENIVGGRIPKQYIPAVEKGFRRCLLKGPVAEYPVVRLGTVIEDGSYHEVDSSDRAFQLCAEACFRETFRKTKPVLLEPIMKVEIECPETQQGPIAGDITSRRGVIMTTGLRDGISHLTAEIPLAELFGYATDLRSLTQGQGTFTMELHVHRRVPASIHEAVVTERRKQLATVNS